VNNTPLAKIEAGTAAEICARFLLNKQAQALLGTDMAPHQFLEALMTHKQYVSGIDFLAHALPPREAVWWGCLCFQHACGDSMSPPDRAAAAATLQWVLQPGDSARTAAKSPAEAAGPASVAGALAMAVYQTGPGLAADGRTPATPAPFASAKAVANAVKIACTKIDPAKMIETQKSFVELGIGVAEGRFIVGGPPQ
jgi:hypothetical protein